MEPSSTDLASMSDDQFRDLLITNGIAAGPITSTTRRLLEKKLLRVLGKVSDVIKEGMDETVTGTSPVQPGAQVTVNNEAKQSSSSTTTSDSHVFYGVAIPQTGSLEEEADVCVFTDQLSALRMVKQFPGARFKVFSNKEDALQFASQPATGTAMVSQPTPAQPVPGESSEFRGPKVQDLSKFRHLIEKGDLAAIAELVWANPRYLISAVDTPVILQEGCRYNALHVCSLKNQPDIATFVVKTIEDEAFIGRLYPLDSETSRADRIRYLVDLYLNMPDKGNCESPLHFACKFGHVDMVQALLECPATDRHLLNIRSETADQVTCTRVGDKDGTIKQEIRDMLAANCYIPLLRPIDKSSVATIGHPWSASDPKGVTSTIRSDPTDSPLALDAFAGPMSSDQAEKFRKKWMVPSTVENRQRFLAICCQDDEKGLERIGRMIAQEEGVEWREYWEFLDDYVDLSSPAGLKMFDSHLERLACELSLANFNNSSMSQTVLDTPQALEDSFEEKLTSLQDQFAMMVLKSPSPKKPVSSPKISDSTAEKLAETAKYMDSMQCDLPPVDLEKMVPPPVQFGNVTDSLRLAPVSCGVEGVGVEELSQVLLPPGGLSERRSPGEKDSGCDSDSNTSLDTYYTAVESPPASPRWLNPQTPENEENLVFVLGVEPSKADSDVLRALDSNNITPEVPNVARWHRHVTAYSEDIRNRWSSPHRDRPWSTTPRPGPRTQASSQTPTCTKSQSHSLQGIRTNLMTALSES